jgi:hypothetical protein
MYNRHMKIYSASLITREMQIQATTRRHLTPIRLVIKDTKANKCSQRCRGKGTLAMVGMQTSAATVRNSMETADTVLSLLL